MLDPAPAFLLLASLAAGMAAITAYLVRWAAEARTVSAGAVVLFLIGMMIAMLAGALLYYRSPGRTGLVDGLWLASGVMSLSVFPVVTIFLKETTARVRAGAAYVAPVLRRRWAFALAVVGLVLLNELLMGYTFGRAAGAIPAVSGGTLLGNLALAVNSPWFLLPMALEMGLSVLLLRDLLPASLRGLLLAQAGLMALAPTAFSGTGAVRAATVLGSAVMIVVVIVVMEHLYRHPAIETARAAYIAGLFGAYAAMMAGLYVWLTGGGGFLFAGSVLLEMALFFEVALLPERFGREERFTWQLEPEWTFALLSGIFLAELFMGAVLDLAVEPAAYAGVFPALPLTGSLATALSNAASNGFWFLADVTGSTWFLAMMGVEMGALVAFKMREVRQRETKVRMGLMLACYAAFAVFFPSLYYSTLFPNAPTGTAVPFLGWSMGIGSAPLAPSVFTVLIVTYAVTGALALLFGRRAICSVFCTAAVMYQGTTIDRMKSFNRTSRIGHKYLGSRFSRAYSVTTGAVMAGLIGASGLSYLDSIGRLNVTVGGTDPTVFLFALSFGVLWYVTFVSIPYVGNYNCVTLGYCYTGTIASAFQKIGFFSLKVRDKKICQACTTIDCAKSCPVGLVDMPGHFRTKGVFRSTKCCGVGSCADACPYGNLYLFDVRHWIAERVGLRRGPSTANRLTVLPNPGARSAPTNPPPAIAASPGPAK